MSSKTTIWVGKAEIAQNVGNRNGLTPRVINSLETELAGSEYNNHFQIYQGLLFKKVEGGERDWRLVVPDGLVDKVIWDCHLKYGHFGAKVC